MPVSAYAHGSPAHLVGGHKIRPTYEVGRVHMLKEAMFYKTLGNEEVSCYLCSHLCRILPGRRGVCGVRKNKDGKLYTCAYGRLIASHIDPIEKKPLYHFLPGSSSYSVAAMGCNFKCSFCQNWQISQVSGKGETFPGEDAGAEDIVNAAAGAKCKSISYTYTEPTIFFEYAYDTAIFAKERGLYNIFVTNGYMTEESLETIAPYLGACNVDLKSFSDDFYKKICRGRLAPVLQSIKTLKKLGVWVEITTLVIPGQNDSAEELKRIAGFIAGVGIDIPWHVTRFHPDYNYLDAPSTPMEILKKAGEIGKQAGLRYVYFGNVFEGNNTFCYNCGSLLIEREIYRVTKYVIRNKKCHECGVEIDGIF